MKLRFYIIEDDPATRRMLEHILQESQLGHVVGFAADGLEVDDEDVKKADVILIDLLMPRRDGIQTIRELKEIGFNGRFIMISQVENKDMVEDAYKNGIDMYITKPINRLEVISVIKRVGEHLELEQSLETIRKTLTSLGDYSDRKKESAMGQLLNEEFSLSHIAKPILSQLGAAGEAGTRDLLALLAYLEELHTHHIVFHSTISLSDMYKTVLSRTQKQESESQLRKEARAMEQRIRRTVFQVLSHLASLGLTDYTNPIFEQYAPRLFDFQEVRKRMREIEIGQKNTACRIHIRKFVFALYEELLAAKSEISEKKL